jgi:hypothetical protein
MCTASIGPSGFDEKARSNGAGLFLSLQIKPLARQRAPKVARISNCSLSEGILTRQQTKTAGQGFLSFFNSQLVFHQALSSARSIVISSFLWSQLNGPPFL